MKLVGLAITEAASGEVALLYVLILMGVALTIWFCGVATGRIGRHGG